MSETRNKILELKNVIYKLYCEEGKSLNYISSLLEVNRKCLTDMVNNEFLFEKKYIRQITPRISKLLNTHKSNLISFFLNSDETSLQYIYNEMGISENLLKTMCDVDIDLLQAKKIFLSKPSLSYKESLIRYQNKVEREQLSEDLEGEIWKDILGYEGRYQVSNLGRVKSLIHGIRILKPTLNKLHNRNYVSLVFDNKRRNLKVYRLVALTFLPNPNNLPTVNHKNGDTTDDRLENLEWASQEYQNYHKNYVLKRDKPKAFSKNGNFKKIILDNKYEFKTIKALSSFLGYSETQVQRYISGETAFDRKIEFIY